MFVSTKFREIGQQLFSLGYNNSHSGNISLRRRDSIFITHTGSMLHKLKSKDIVKVSIHPNPSADKKASMELGVHRAIYNSKSDVYSVIHAHAPYAIALVGDGTQKVIIPYDHEGQYYFDSIPTIVVKNGIASQDVANKISEFTKTAGAVIVAKHGIFAWGKDLNEALKYLTVTESICRVNFLVEGRNATKND